MYQGCLKQHSLALAAFAYDDKREFLDIPKPGSTGTARYIPKLRCVSLQQQSTRLFSPLSLAALSHLQKRLLNNSCV